MLRRFRSKRSSRRAAIAFYAVWCVTCALTAAVALVASLEEPWFAGLSTVFMLAAFAYGAFRLRQAALKPRVS